MHSEAENYKPVNPVRVVTATSLFDGHDAAINIFRRILQSSGAEVIPYLLGFASLWGTSIANYLIGTVLVFWLGSVFFNDGTLTLGSVY